jgi:hypothetical protein
MASSLRIPRIMNRWTTSARAAAVNDEAMERPTRARVVATREKSYITGSEQEARHAP